MGAHEQTGLAACYSLDEYDRDIIKKHERTRRDKEDDRTRHMIELRAQTGVVFLTYHASGDVDRSSAARVDCRRAALRFHGRRRRAAHDLARDRRRRDALIAAFARVPALYIADGHHRAASAARARAELRRRQAHGGEADTTSRRRFPDDQVQILPYNRIVKDLAGRRRTEFLAAVRRGCRCARAGDAVAQGGGRDVPRRRWYTLELRRGRGAGRRDRASLDVAMLQRAVLEPLLGIGDVRTDKRIDFVGGARGTAALERRSTRGRAAVAFSLFPVTMDDLMAISDAGGIMPPKSTWFEPKLRDGLLVHVI